MSQAPHVNHADVFYQGQIYPLSHLNGFDFSYGGLDTASGQITSFDVRVLFGDHCYTSGVPHAEAYDPAAVVSRSVREVRVLSLERYRLSHMLPELVRGLMDRPCYFGDQDNFFTIDLSTGEKYNVYFTVSKVEKRGGLRLRIQSSYLRPRVDRLQKVRFGLILRGVRDNRPVKPPR